MTIEIRNDYFYLGMWNAALADHQGDVMAIAWRPMDGAWVLEYRFRYYKDRKTFDSQDTKNWYRLQAPDGSEAEGLKLQTLFTSLLEKGQREGFVQGYRFIECRGTGEQMLKILMNPEDPWLKHQTLTEEEFHRYEQTGELPKETT